MTDDYVSDLRAFCAQWLKQNAGCDLIDHGFGAEHGGELTTVKLTAALDELERLRAVRTCGDTATLFNGDQHVCVLPFGHGPEHRDHNGTRWQVYDAHPESDDALKALVRMQGLTLSVSQQPERVDGA